MHPIEISSPRGSGTCIVIRAGGSLGKNAASKADPARDVSAGDHFARRSHVSSPIGLQHDHDTAAVVAGDFCVSRRPACRCRRIGEVRPQPLLAVRDVEASSRWYQHLFGCQSAHGGPDYERLVADGELVLQLHDWALPHEHGAIGDPKAEPHGNGVLVWFEVDDFDAAVARAGELGAEVIMAPHRNPPEGRPGGPAHREMWLRDPDGYAVVLASPDGEAA
jgi:predicted enzyme related to lactoylglutathione lyase